LFLVTTCGWFALAYREFGDALIERMITGELISHSVGTDEGLPGSRFWEPISNFASNFLPWSILAGIAFYRLWRHPATSVSERRLERFLFCWFMVGLIALSLASHQRARLILPILPPAALLAGRELARWADGKQFGWRLYLGVVAILLTGVGLYFHVAKPHADSAELTRDMREAARQATSQSPHRYPLLHADSPFSFRYYRCELQPRITLDAAAEILRDPLPAFVAVRNAKRLEERFGSLPANVHEIFRWPTQTPRVHVFSNQPRSEEVTRFAFRIGSISADITGAEFVAADWSALTLRPGKTPAVVVLTNRGSSAIPMSVRFLKDTGSTKVGRELAPGEEWKLDASALLEQAAPSTRAQ
jgi:hypothetical protein